MNCPNIIASTRFVLITFTLVCVFANDKYFSKTLPTGRFVEIPLVVVMKFVDSKIAHAHIYLDHALLLAQIGLSDTSSLPARNMQEFMTKSINQNTS